MICNHWENIISLVDKCCLFLLLIVLMMIKIATCNCHSDPMENIFFLINGGIPQKIL